MKPNKKPNSEGLTPGQQRLQQIRAEMHGDEPTAPAPEERPSLFARTFLGVPDNKRRLIPRPETQTAAPDQATAAPFIGRAVMDTPTTEFDARKAAILARASQEAQVLRFGAIEPLDMGPSQPDGQQPPQAPLA